MNDDVIHNKKKNKMLSKTLSRVAKEAKLDSKKFPALRCQVARSRKAKY